MRFILPDDAERERRLPRLFALLFDSAGPTGMRLITAGGEAATLWRAPGRVHVGRLEMLRRAAPLWRALRFRVAAEWTVPGGGPRFWSMLREPDATVTA